MIDMFSRFTVSVFINRKLPSNVIHVLMKEWIAYFGVMKSVLTDNGGEFNSDEMRDVMSVLNVKIATTPAESPWSN